MAAQSLLAKLGMRMSTLGTAANLAVAFPLAEGDPSMAAHTDADRIGLYADRTVGDEYVGVVVMGVNSLQMKEDELRALTPIVATAASGFSQLLCPADAGGNTYFQYDHSDGTVLLQSEIIGGFPLMQVNDNTATATGAEEAFKVTTYASKPGLFSVLNDTVTTSYALRASAGVGNANAIQAYIGAGAGTAAVINIEDDRGTLGYSINATDAGQSLFIGMQLIPKAVNPGGADTLWIDSGTNHLMRGATDLQAGGGGTIGGSIAANQVAFGSGANTIQGDNKFQFTTTNGLVVNLAATGADNLTIGSTAGNSLTSGTQNTLIGTNAGTALTTTSDAVAIGFNALAACTVADNVAVGSGAADAVTSSIRVVAIGKNALGAGTTAVNDSTAVGYQALLLATGANNTAVGSNAGDAITSGARHTAIGANALSAGNINTDNVAIGYNAMLVATVGETVAVGSGALDSLTSGQFNVAVGYLALAAVVSGIDNVAMGWQAATATTGSQNIAIGGSALEANVGGNNNTVVGVGGMRLGTAVNDNTALGYQALRACTANNNTAVGSGAADILTSSTRVVAVGLDALGGATTGASDNTAIGYNALLVNNAIQCTAVGSGAGSAVTGATNTLVGYNAGSAIGAGTGNTCIGAAAASNSGLTNNVGIGANTLFSGAGANSSIAIGEGATVNSSQFSIALGRGASVPATTSNTMVVGSSTGSITTVYFGNGVTATAPANVTIRATSAASGTTAGANLILAAGVQSGVTTSGSVIIQTATPGVAALANRWFVDSWGGTNYVGVTTAAGPGVSAANQAIIFYDTTLQQLRVSMNTGAYTNLVGSGTIGGSIAANQVAVGSGANTIAGTNNLTWSSAGGLSSNRSSALRNEMFGASAGNTTMSGTDNTLIGYQCGDAFTTGSRNTAMAATALTTCIVGNDNAAYGWNALNAYTGSECTAFGSEALALLTTAARVTAVGYLACANAQTGASDSVAVGHKALWLNSAVETTAVGSASLDANISSTGHTAVGFNTLSTITAGNNCTAVGHSALAAATGGNNTAVGYGAADAVTSAVRVTVMGTDALGTGTTGVSDCTALGYNALLACTGASNTAIGSGAGDAITSGTANVAIGVTALGGGNATACIAIGNSALAVNASSFNVAIGHATAPALTGGSNTLIGAGIGTQMTTASGNVAVGLSAMEQQQGCSDMIGIGNNALRGSLTPASNTGTACVAVGTNALLVNSSGSNNIAVGTNALIANTTGSGNVIVGALSGNTMTTGSRNIAIGPSALAAGTTLLNDNIAIGSQALAITTYERNIAIGTNALSSNTNTAQNVAIGYISLQSATATFNTAIGAQSGSTVTTGGSNVLIGAQAGGSLTSGTRNVIIGATSTAAAAATDSIAIGYAASAAFDESIAIGRSAVCTAVNQMVIGADQYDITDVYIGNGVTNAAANSEVTIHTTGGASGDDAGSHLILAAGMGYGSGGAGIYLRVALPGSGGGSGSQNLLTNSLICSLDGTVWAPRDTPASSPSAGTVVVGTTGGQQVAIGGGQIYTDGDVTIGGDLTPASFTMGSGPNLITMDNTGQLFVESQIICAGLVSAGSVTTASGGFTTGDDYLMKSSVPLFDGAGGNTGTLTNAPTAGDPTKWLIVNDNGTPRYVPAW